VCCTPTANFFHPFSASISRFGARMLGSQAPVEGSQDPCVPFGEITTRSTSSFTHPADLAGLTVQKLAVPVAQEMKIQTLQHPQAMQTLALQSTSVDRYKLNTAAQGRTEGKRTQEMGRTGRKNWKESSQSASHTATSYTVVLICAAKPLHCGCLQSQQARLTPSLHATLWLPICCTAFQLCRHLHRLQHHAEDSAE
jgi:hypothetical protein